MTFDVSRLKTSMEQDIYEKAAIFVARPLKPNVDQIFPMPSGQGLIQVVSYRFRKKGYSNFDYVR